MAPSSKDAATRSDAGFGAAAPGWCCTVNTNGYAQPAGAGSVRPAPLGITPQRCRTAIRRLVDAGLLERLGATSRFQAGALAAQRGRV